METGSVQILCVDDERNVLRSIERMFIDDDYEILTASSGEEGLELLCQNENVQVVLSDYRMPGMNGIEFLKEACRQRPDTIRIVLSGYADTAAVVAAINEGQIYKFIPKPWNDEELKVTVAKAIETFALHQENKQLSEALRVKNEELKQLNANLEHLITERTGELILQNRALVHARNVLEHLPVGVMALLSDGAIAQINLAAAAILGQQADDFVSEKMQAVLPADLCNLVSRVLTEKAGTATLALNGGTIRARAIVMEENGNEGVILTLSEECS